MVVGFVSVHALLHVSPLSAQDDQRARLHYESGASYYEAGEYEDALREFRRAHELSQRPQLFYNISLCYQNLGDLEQAASFLERYLQDVQTIENRANLEIRLRNLRERMERARESDVPDPGAVEQPGRTEAIPDESSSTARAESETSSMGEGDPSSTAAATPSESLNIGAVVGFSVAAVGLVVGGVFGGLTLAEDSRLAGTPCGMAGTCGGADVSDLRTFAVVTDVGFGVALAGAAVGAVFLLIGPPSSGGERASLRTIPFASGNQLGLSFEGSF
jgi:hypothetical protein